MTYTEKPPEDAPDTASELVAGHEAALKDVLRELTSVYHTGNDSVPVRFDAPPCAFPNGEVQIDPTFPDRVDPDVSGPLVLRALDDTLCHEVAHLNWSDLTVKREFSEEYPGWGEVPGFVANVLEDAHIDARRRRKWYGMRAKAAYSAWLIMETDEITPPLDELAEEEGELQAMISGMSQLASAGFVKYEDASAMPTEVWEFLERVEPVIDRIRTQNRQEERHKLFHVAMRTLMEFVDEPEAIDDSTVPGSGVPQPAPGGDPEEVEEEPPEEVAEMIEELEIEGDGGSGPAKVQSGEELEDDGDAEQAQESKSAEQIEQQFDVEVESIDEADTRERQRWATLVKRLDEYDTAIEERKRKRDSRMDPGVHRGSNAGRKLRAEAERLGIIQQLKQGFAQFVTRPTPKPAEVGPRMDVPNVVRRASGDLSATDLFEEDIETDPGDRCIGICADASGSMSGDMDEVKLAAACIAKATEIIGDDFVCEAYTTVDHDTPTEMDLRIVTAPHEDFEWEHLNSFCAEEGTPTAAGVRDTRVLMEECSASEYLMVVITDGTPSHTEDGGDDSFEAIDQTRRAVEECRADGIDVLGIGVGSVNHEDMEATFGGDGYKMTTMEALADDVLSLYESRMNVER